jgi:hypothetical protein
MDKEAKPTTAAVEEGVVVDSKTKAPVTGSTTSGMPDNALGIASLTVSILSLPLTFCFGVFCIPLPLVSLVLGIMGQSKYKKATGNNDTLSMIGIAISAVAIIVPILFAVLFVGTSFLQTIMGQ